MALLTLKRLPKYLVYEVSLSLQGQLANYPLNLHMNKWKNSKRELLNMRQKERWGRGERKRKGEGWMKGDTERTGKRSQISE